MSLAQSVSCREFFNIRESSVIVKHYQMPTSIVEFELHTKNHIKRAKILALEILSKRFQDFHLLDTIIVSEFMSLHDHSKVNKTEKFLKKYSLEKRKTSISEDLFSIFGKWSQLDEAKKKWAASLRDELNNVDQQVAMDFFSENGYVLADGSLSATAQQLLRLEKIADILDTIMDPVRAKEFGSTKERLGIENAYGLKNQEDKKIAAQFIPYYLRRAQDPNDELFR